MNQIIERTMKPTNQIQNISPTPMPVPIDSPASHHSRSVEPGAYSLHTSERLPEYTHTTITPVKIRINHVILRHRKGFTAFLRSYSILRFRRHHPVQLPGKQASTIH